MICTTPVYFLDCAMKDAIFNDTIITRFMVKGFRTPTHLGLVYLPETM